MKDLQCQVELLKIVNHRTHRIKQSFSILYCLTVDLADFAQSGKTERLFRFIGAPFFIRWVERLDNLLGIHFLQVCQG